VHSVTPLPKNETERLHVLRSIEPRSLRGLDDFALVAAELLDVEAAVISLVDIDVERVVAAVGTTLTEIDRNTSLAGHTILSASGLVVEDLAADKRFREHPLVLGVPHIRFFASTRILVNRQPVGALSVWSSTPRAPARARLQALAALGRRLGAALDLQLRSDQIRLDMVRLDHAQAETHGFLLRALHDLKGPVRVVDVYLERALTNANAQLDEETRTYLGFASHGIARAKQGITALVEYSRTNSEVEGHDTVDLYELVESVIADLVPEILRLGADVRVRELPEIKGDRAGIVALFRQLIVNSLEAAIDTEPPRVEIGAEVIEGELTYFVRDYGMGVPEADQERVFEPFERVNRRTSANARGAGVGLAIARRVVRRHHGAIWMESTPGIETTVWFTLPTPNRE
jgi:signal transduction histidine kinase